MIRVLSISFLLLSFWGCKRYNRIEDEISAFHSKHIILPFDEMKCLNNGKDTIVLERERDIDLKYILYIDSTRCSSCIWKDLHRWNSFLHDIKAYKGRVKVYFIFKPLSFKIDELYLSMRRHAILESYVYIDTTNVFLQENAHFPVNPLLHTFLLDKDNTVLLVGDPINNLRINKIFWKIVEDKLGKSEHL